MRRRRAVVAVACVLVSLVTFGSANATTHKAKPKPKPVPKRTVSFQFSYLASETVHSSIGPGGQLCGPYDTGLAQSQQCFSVTAPSWGRYMTITSSDATGRPAPLVLYPAATGVNAMSTETFLCGGVKDSSVSGNDAWTISVARISADASCPGPATEGTFTVTISNKP